MRKPLKASSFTSGLARAAAAAVLTSCCLALAVGVLDAPPASAKVRVNPGVDGVPRYVPSFPEVEPPPRPVPKMPGETDNAPATRTLADEETGATVTGDIEDGATLRVARGCDGGILHVAGKCDACDKIRGAIPTADYLQPYMVEVEGSYSGSMDGSFEVGTEFNGRNATVYLCKDGNLRLASSTVKEGRVKACFEPGKRLAVVVPERPEPMPEEDEPPYAVIGLVALCAIGYVLYRKKRRNGSGLR